MCVIYGMYLCDIWNVCVIYGMYLNKMRKIMVRDDGKQNLRNLQELCGFVVLT
jgi:hypothetical protein